MARQPEATDWRVASGGPRRYPWFITRPVPGGNGFAREYAENAAGTGARHFKTREAAERVAEKLQRTADLDNARESARMAVHHLIRATDHLPPGHPLVAIAVHAGDVYLALTTQKL